MKKQRLEDLILAVLILLVLVMGGGLLVGCGVAKESVLDSPKYHIPKELEKDLVRESQPFSGNTGNGSSK